MKYKDIKKIFGIETSCDETAVAYFDCESLEIDSQIYANPLIHQEYLGIVPELASRDHASNLLTLITNLSNKHGKPDAIACTIGPGLPGCLTAGLALALSLSYSWQIPLAPVNHLEGHLLSPFLENDPEFNFPYLALLITGGHTLLVDVKNVGDYEVLGSTLDDAVGEAFDKVAILLGLDFPGGANLEKLANSVRISNLDFPQALKHRHDLNFSFSGLKTAARNFVQEDLPKNEIAFKFQESVFAQLLNRTAKALRKTKRAKLAIVGGVACNLSLRNSFANLADDSKIKIYYPNIKWCTDNAAMIAYAGQYRIQDSYSIGIRPNWKLEDL